MDEVHPDQSQPRWTHEPHEIVVVDPDNGEEEVTHRIADGCGPQRPESRECRLTGSPELEYHDGHDHREDRVRIGGQPMCGFPFFRHGALHGVSKASINLNRSAALTGVRGELDRFEGTA
jgi:hypothetical protein